MLPVFLDLSGKRIVVFGGGEVGFRKASYFEEEADVMVVSRTFCNKFNGSALRTLHEDAEKVLEGMIENADMVVAARATFPDLVKAVEERLRQSN